MPLSNESGYYNEFDPSDNYYEVRALAGRVEQSREDNESQAILSHKLKKLGDTLYRNGLLVRGGSFKQDSLVLNIDAGDVYYNGIVHEVPAAQLTLVGSGEETVGVVFTESLVTYLTDNNLRDPAVGHPNAGLQGANRLKITKVWAVNNPLAIPVYVFKDGALAKDPRAGEIDIVTQTLARRTFDESGNYTVQGFDINLEPKDSSQFNVVIGNSGTSSKAYVQGYEIIKLLPERVAVRKAQDTRAYTIDQVAYAGSSSNVVINGTTYNSGYLIKLAYKNVARINTSSAEFRTNNKSITHTGVGSADVITGAGEALRAVYGVKNTSGGAIAYTSPTDYTVVGNTISWAPAGAEPSVNNTYFVDYRYERTLLSNEYALVVDQTNGDSYIDITALSVKPDLPSGGPSTVDVSYDYYLSRADVIYLKPDGKVEILEGVPEEVAAAKVVPPGMLGLAEILIAPGGGHDKASIVKYNNRRYTMEDITSILTRLERQEYNTAIKDLDTDAQTYAGANISTLSGILTEGFRYTADQMAKDGQNGQVTVKYDTGLTSSRIIDVVEQELVLPETKTDAQINILSGSTTGRKWAKSVSLATTSESVAEITQTKATSILKVNPYGTNATFPIIFISPTEDVEGESDTTIAGTVSLSSVTPLTQTRELPPPTLLESNKSNNLKQFNSTLRSFIKSGKLVHVRGYGFTASTQVQCFFDNQQVALTAITSSSGLPTGITLPATNTASGDGGRVTTNAAGEFLATFTTPVGVPVGTIAVLVSDASGKSASNTFQGRGLLKSVANAIETSASDVIPTPSALASSTKDTITASVPAPVISSFTPPSNIGGASGTATFAGSFTGLATEVMLTLGNGVTQGPYTLAQGATTFSVVSSTLSAGTTYSVALKGPGGTSEPKTGSISVASAPPAGSPPVVTQFSTYISRSGNTTFEAEFSWNTTGAQKVTFQFSNSYVTYSGTGVTVSGNVATGPTSGTMRATFKQSGTLTMYAHSSTQQSAPRTYSVNVPKYPEGSKIDPLAQTFTLTKSSLITAIDVYFKAKSATSPVILQIRNTINGAPGTTVLASKQLAPTEVNVSADASSVTTFTFDDPAWLTIDSNKGSRDYCFVLISDSADYEAYVAKVGELTLGVSPQLVVTQPYLDGIAFVSSNDTAWTAVQDTDLKFSIKSATFDQSAGNLVTLESISTANCTGMNLAVTTTGLDSSNQIKWEYRLNGVSEWFSFVPGNYCNFSLLASQIDIRGTLTGTTLSSPIIQTSSMAVTLLFRQTSGEYITKRATFQTAYDTVRLVTRTFVPNACTVKVYFTDETSGAGPGSFTWTEITSWGTTFTLPDGKYVEKDNNPGAGPLSSDPNRKFFRFRIRLETTDRTQTPRVRDIMAIVNA